MKNRMKRVTTLSLMLCICLSCFAVTIPAGTKLFLDPNDQWSGTTYTTYFYNSASDNEMVRMTASTERPGRYEVVAPADYDSLIFIHGTTWTSEGNQTINLSCPGIFYDEFVVNKTFYAVNKATGSWLQNVPDDKVLRNGTFSLNENTMCSGENCFYEGPSVVINEIYTNAGITGQSEGNGSLYKNREYSGEWIELYNPNKCEAIDISGYFFATTSTSSDKASYVLPEACVIPPLGFIVIRGDIQKTTVPTEELVENGGRTIDLELTEPNRMCTNELGLWLPDAGGWLGFYDNTGKPIDAISWGNVSNDAKNTKPCTPMNLPVTLCSYNDFTANGGYVTYYDPPASGFPEYLSVYKTPDGGTWSSTAAEPTKGTCNTTPCAEQPAVIGCTGKATVTGYEGGVGTIKYMWSDPNVQTNATATGLCGGTYFCVLEDEVGQKLKVGPIVITDPDPTITVTHEDVVTSQASLPLQLSSLNKGTPTGGIYNGCNIDENGILQTAPEGNSCEAVYSVKDPVTHCFNETPFTITISSIIIDVTHEDNTKCDGVPYSPTGDPALMCTGTATVTANGGVAPYTYLWNDPAAQTTAMAKGLCAGDYSVTVKDNTGTSVTASVTIEQPTPDVDHPDVLNQSSSVIPLDLAALNKGVPTGGTFTGCGITDGKNITSLPSGNTCQVTYTININGCTNSTEFTVSFVEDPCNISKLELIPSAADCTNDTYTLRGTVEFTNPPATGKLLITEINSGKTVELNAPFTSPSNFEFIELNADGTTKEVTAEFIP